MNASRDVLLPGEKMPLPDHSDPQIEDQLKIAIRPIKIGDKMLDEKVGWGQEFKLHKLKTVVKPNINVLWKHGKTYSILRKLKTSLENAHDIVLLPPIIVTNNLPSRISVKISGIQAPDIYSLSVSSSTGGMVQDRQISLEKQESASVENIQEFKDDITISVYLT